jgi:hypothetical protein
MLAITKCPVKEACKAISKENLSLISPIKITSGVKRLLKCTLFAYEMYVHLKTILI